MLDSAPVLIVDDEPDFARGLSRILKRAFPRWDCIACTSGEAALEVLMGKNVGVMLTDLRMPGMNGIDLLKKALAVSPQLCIVLMTAYGTIEDAVKSLKLGAYDFITKPVQRDTLCHMVEKAMERYLLVTENRRLREITAGLETRQMMIGESPAMQHLNESIAAVAATDYTVLIRGESGTGKELAARSIHQPSKRAGRPLLSVNCPAIPEQLLESELFGHVKGAFTGADRNRKGLFETADNSTLLMDEIGDVSPGIQAKLLRVLQEKEIRPVGSSEKKKVDVRILATTNQNLEAKIRAGSFREDLFYRLNVLTLTLPPLRDRRQDIPLLVRHFTALTCREMRLAQQEISADALAYLSTRSWPGNVRELLNFVRRMVVFSGGQPVSLPLVKLVEKGGLANGRAGGEIISYKEAKARVMDDFTSGYVNAILRKTGGNISEAARLSGLERVSLQKIIRRLDIDVEAFREAARNK
jgi:DNA-binding NtrC family response regulator